MITSERIRVSVHVCMPIANAEPACPDPAVYVFSVCGGVFLCASVCVCAITSESIRVCAHVCMCVHGSVFCVVVSSALTCSGCGWGTWCCCYRSLAYNVEVSHAYG